MTELTFEWQIDEFLIYCHSKQLRPKTTQSYEQALRLFARWCEEERHIDAVDKVKEADIRKVFIGSSILFLERKRTKKNFN